MQISISRIEIPLLQAGKPTNSCLFMCRQGFYYGQVEGEHLKRSFILLVPCVITTH